MIAMSLPLERGYSPSSSANSLQVPYFLIRRAAKKVTFIANMRTDLRVCECVCILPIYTIHAVTVLTTFITKST